ncbi:MAG TPA: hypothetical protein VH540_28125 [Ktedonobacterales bacterium]
MKVPTFAVLADYANLTSDGKLNIMGIFNEIRARSFPVVHPQMRLVLQLEGSPAERGSTKNIQITLLDADGKQLLEVAAPFSIPETAPLKPVLQSVVELAGISFPHQGDYTFSILVNGEEKATVPFSVVLVAPSS